MKVSECLDYLSSTDDRLGQLKAAYEYHSDYKCKRVKAEQFLKATGTKDERESRAYVSQAMEDVMNDKNSIKEELETIIAKRKTCELTIEVWRSQSANKRQGNI